MGNYYFCRHIHHCHIDNELTILDEISDRYIFLTKEQTSSLIKFMNGDEVNFIGGQLEHSGVISSNTGVSIKDSVPKTSGVGLLQWNSEIKLQISHLNPFKIFEAFITVIRVKHNLEKKGLHYCLEYSRMLLSNSKQSSFHDDNFIIKAKMYGYYLKLVAPFIPFKIQCLEFSLSLFYLLIKEGISPVMFIGFQRYDFLSHAWIEVDGNVIMDNDELGKRLNVIVRVGV